GGIALAHPRLAVRQSSAVPILPKRPRIPGRSTPMWSTTRRALAVVLGVGFLALVTLGGDAIAQIAVKVRGPVVIGPGGGPVPPDEQPADDPNGNHAIQLPTDSRARRMVEAGRDYVKDKDWERAVRVLQQLLDRKEDVFVELARTRPDGKETTEWVSAKTEA